MGTRPCNYIGGQDQLCCLSLLVLWPDKLVFVLPVAPWESPAEQLPEPGLGGLCSVNHIFWIRHWNHHTPLLCHQIHPQLHMAWPKNVHGNKTHPELFVVSLWKVHGNKWRDIFQKGVHFVNKHFSNCFCKITACTSARRRFGSPDRLFITGVSKVILVSGEKSLSFSFTCT